MHTTTDVHAWIGQQLMGSDDDKIGKVDEIYVDRESGDPKFLAVKTGLFGNNVSFVPIEEARGSGDQVTVPYTKDQVKDAPNVDADGEISREEEQRIFEHYNLTYSAYDGPDHESLLGRDRGRTSGTDSDREGRFARDGDDDAPGTVGHDTSGPTTDDAMTRSEEELTVGKTSRETGRARLRKYVVTEQVEETIPVQREEVRVEREPITDANAGQALDGPAISEEEHEVTLHAEEPVVEKRAVPKERVRLEKDSVTEDRTVSDEVRKERIETDGADETR
jgi:uncharacterized protein (TIGR02271 family)